MHTTASGYPPAKTPNIFISINSEQLQPKYQAKRFLEKTITLDQDAAFGGKPGSWDPTLPVYWPRNGQVQAHATDRPFLVHMEAEFGTWQICRDDYDLLITAHRSKCNEE